MADDAARGARAAGTPVESPPAAGGYSPLLRPPLLSHFETTADGDLVLRPPVFVGFERGRRYLVHEQLGGGTFGQVWLAETVETLGPLGSVQAGAAHGAAADFSPPAASPPQPTVSIPPPAVRRGRRRANTDPVRPQRHLLQMQQVQQAQQETGSGRKVAIKVIKRRPAYFSQGLLEVSILDMLQQSYDVDEAHLVSLLDSFLFQGHLCLVFEALGSNLYSLLQRNEHRGLGIERVRTIGAQLRVSLSVLSDAQLLHCDITPENILLLAGEDGGEGQVKLIDFGSACFSHQTVYSYIQSRFYRAPEVILGCGYGPPLDLWSFGAVLAELFLGVPLLPGMNNYQ